MCGKHQSPKFHPHYSVPAKLAECKVQRDDNPNHGLWSSLLEMKLCFSDCVVNTYVYSTFVMGKVACLIVY